MTLSATTTRTFIDSTAATAGRPMGLDEVVLLADKDRKVPFEFSFEYQGVVFQVVASPKDQGTSIRFRAILGNLPYTSEHPVARRHATMIIYAASKVLGGRVRLSSRQHIALIDDIWVSEPMTPVLLLSQAAKLLVGAKPYLELLAVYVRPPMAPPQRLAAGGAAGDAAGDAGGAE